MAPKAGTKRAAQTSKATQPAKAQKKTDKKSDAPKYSDPLMEGLVDTVQQSRLPDDCKAMLKSIIPHAFVSAVEERRESQTMVVGMVGEVTEEMHTDMTKELGEADAAVEEATAKKIELEAAVTEAENALTLVEQKVQEKDTGLQDAIKLANEKQATLDSLKEAQTKGDAELATLKEQKEASAAAFADNFKPSITSDLEEQESMKHFKVIQPFVSQLGLDESMLAALPTTCQKKHSERGAFDKVVMEQLDQGWQASITVLAANIEGGGVAAAERAAGVTTAEQEVCESNALKENAEKELRSEEERCLEAKGLLETSKKAVADIQLKLKALGAARDEKASARNIFESWNMHCFTQLKDKSVVTKEAPTITEPVEPEVPAEPTVPAVQAVAEEITQPKETIVDETNKPLVSQAGA